MARSETQPEGKPLHPVSDVHALRPARPRVFISYSHDSDQHMTRCLTLAQQLRQHGIDAWIDQFESAPEQGWPRWAYDQLLGAAYTLVVCTEQYRRRFEGQETAGTGQGVVWEGAITQQLLYDDDARNRRFIPVLLDDVHHAVPRVLRGATHYRLPQDFEPLLRRLSEQPAVEPVPVGQLVQFPARGTDDPELVQLRMERKQRQIAGEAVAELDGRILIRRRQLREGIPVGEGTRLHGQRFEIIELIGQGGFAKVYKAYDNHRAEVVAVKLLHHQYAEDRTRRERFFRGARQMAALKHPGVVDVILEQGQDDGELAYVVMEYLAGGDLKKRVLAPDWEPALALPLLVKVTEALAAAHRRGLIHRDVKPANIVLASDGTPKLTDFDLVHATDTTGGTRTHILGTPEYAAPEALKDASRVTPAADVFSLGMVALYMLRGEEPAEYRAHGRLLNLIADLKCGWGLQRMLSRVCGFDPTARPADADQLLFELRQVMWEEANRATVPPQSSLAARPVNTNHWLTTESNSKRLSGELEDVSLRAVLELIRTSRKTGMLVVRHDDDEARLYLKNGMLSADINGVRATLLHKAMFRILGWHKGEFFVESRDIPEIDGELVSTEEAMIMHAMTCDRLRELGIPPMQSKFVAVRPRHAPRSVLLEHQVMVFEEALEQPTVQAVFDNCPLDTEEIARHLRMLIDLGYLTERGEKASR